MKRNGGTVAGRDAGDGEMDCGRREQRVLSLVSEAADLKDHGKTNTKHPVFADRKVSCFFQPKDINGQVSVTIPSIATLLNLRQHHSHSNSYEL